MRELTGYEDQLGRPILEGDIIRSHAGEIHVVEEINEGWFPLCFFEEADLATTEVIGSIYTERGRRLLAGNGIPWVDEEGQHDGGYEQTLPPHHRQAIKELSALIRSRYHGAACAASDVYSTRVRRDRTSGTIEKVEERRRAWNSAHAINSKAP